MQHNLLNKACRKCPFQPISVSLDGETRIAGCTIGYTQFPSSPEAVAHSLENKAEVCRRIIVAYLPSHSREKEEEE